jgi:hypothetical protein
MNTAVEQLGRKRRNDINKNPVAIPIDPANPAVFYRQYQP